ncbi:hypothetical protein HDV62DRAFT_184726 [Trichoderma sp. SZMC 28011]
MFTRPGASFMERNSITKSGIPDEAEPSLNINLLDPTAQTQAFFNEGFIDGEPNNTWATLSGDNQFPPHTTVSDPRSSHYGQYPDIDTIPEFDSTDNILCDDSTLSFGAGYEAPSNVSTSSLDSLATSASAYARRRRKRQHGTWRPIGSQHTTDARRYQCTFFTDTFKTKYDWRRHEITLHLSLEQWQCARFGPVIQHTDGTIHCAFCQYPEPSTEHLDLHNFSACLARPLQERLFRRKDHLRQHLRLFHNDSDFQEHMESWFFAIDNVRSRCGFCDTNLESWEERQKHLASHFKRGADMKDWKGDRGFDRQIDNLVENDIPAFMIGDQRNTVEPFSASQADHRAEPPNPIFPGESSVTGLTERRMLDTARGFGEVTIQSPHSQGELKRILLAYVSEEIRQGRVPSDRQLQRKMSEIMYGPDGEWDQTWADNPQWLDLFRKQAGLISLPLSGGKNAFIGIDAE